ncbi:uncharacterized protein LOC120258441 isoform X2 [Dioscorea cayenensis subsp. rotundata]|uniref:Uncharacterized protein LOC120258441 isoform X2 n=1 Tax=Dioscorea cayennensis subsp. rotundata TaxID=55577 RepID=A0AB40B3S9_DIOCR|nr:uncharacterized protein LOC120258441 isoform X2 [Dioscorea cayenensis subsp. rotundata]
MFFRELCWCSPVMSLRENLVLMLHDNEGNELSRTELPTMSVVEKGIWDDLFPLKGGGHVHMRVQFSLNEEERLRIRHMRETVVRKKQSELLKGQETGLLGSYPTTQLFSEGTKIEKTEQTDPGVCGGTLSLQEFRESSAQAFKQYDPHHTELSKKEIGISDKQDVSSVEVSNSSLSNELNEWWKLSSEQMIPTKPEQLATTYAGNITEDDQILETRRKGFHRRSLSSNMKKMITAFETILYQGWEPSFSPKLREYSGPNNIKYVKVPQILTKSFSAGMLSDIKSIQNPAVHRSIVEKKGEKSQLYSDSGKSQELANDIILYDTKTANYALEPMETERAFSIRGMVENSNDDIHLSDKASCDVLHGLEIKTDHHVLAEEDLAARKMLYELPVHNVQPCPCTHQGSSSITAMEGNGQINPRTSNEDVLLSRHSDSRGCSSPSLVSCVPRYFCITSGSKQLRDLVECCDLSVGTHLMENYHFINEVHEKESAQGDGLLKMDEDEEISPASEKNNGLSKGMKKSSGLLIEQVVRTVLIIIVGGTLILNTRLRRLR